MRHEVALLDAIPEALHHTSPGKIESEITLTVHSMCALLEGRFDDAMRSSTQAFVLGRRKKHSEAEAFFGLQTVAIFRERERLAEIVEPTIANLTKDPHNTLVRSILAFAYALTGRADDARIEFARLAADEFRGVQRDFAWLGTVAYLAETCVALDDQTNAAVLTRMLLPMAERNASMGLFCYLGPVAYYLGILALTLNDFAEAARHFAAALESAQKIGAVAWVARIQLGLARTLLARDSTGAIDEARELIEAARSTATALGADNLLEIIGSLPTSPSVAKQPEFTPEAAGSGANIFHREGDYWTIAFGGKTIRLHQSKGLIYLSHLLANPAQEIHVLALEALAQGAPNSSSNEVQLIEPASDAGEILDRQAKAQYRARAKEILEELEEARARNDLGRIEMLNDELEAISEQLSAGSGLSGRERRALSNVERARVRIKNTMNGALARLDKAHPLLARHLTSAIKTGVFCSYQPDSAQTARWLL